MHAPEHAEAPVVAENFPAGQSKHAAVDKEVAPEVEYVPTLHANPEHVEAPVVVENVPDWHAWHAPSLYSPAKHWETVFAQNLPASQGWHVPFLYSPAGGLPHCQISHEKERARVCSIHTQSTKCELGILTGTHVQDTCWPAILARDMCGSEAVRVAPWRNQEREFEVSSLVQPMPALGGLYLVL